MRTIHKIIINDNPDSILFVEDREIINNKVKLKVYNEETEGYYVEKKDFIIVETYIVIIHANFIIMENSKDACMVTKGFGEINGLAYTYGIIIFEKPYNKTVFPHAVIYKDAGIAVTRFDMYSYHFNEPEFHYDESRLEYEIFSNLEFSKIL